MSIQNVFTSPAFRQILGKEFKLLPLDINLAFSGKDWSVPAFVRQSPTGNKSLIIGAGFDKTGEITGLAAQHYALFVDTLRHYAQEQQFTQLEVRTQQEIPCLTNHSDKVELVIHLDKPCSERLMEFSKSTRRNIRQPFKQGFHYTLSNEQAALDAFYALYQLNMHELGSLPHSKAFFQAILDECREHIAIFVGFLDDEAVVSSFVFLSAEEAYGAWSGTHPAHKKNNYFLSMLWSITEFCEQTGRQRYNLGRSSSGSGACQFKMRLANEIKPIYYYQLPLCSAAAGRSSVYSMASWLIRHTPPLVMNTLSRQLIHRFY